MRLLQLQENGDFHLSEHVGRDVPPYAILSHTWGADHDEVTYRDLVDGTGKDKAGYKKLLFCAEQAAKDGLQFFWIDTCCIDKSSSTELEEAIYSMFQWYNRADKCYAYLSDVSVNESDLNATDLFTQPTWKSAFQRSRWFTRGWTLQELLAPTNLTFFSPEGHELGSRTSLVQEICQITGISAQALQGIPLSQFSVNERLLWAEKRETKREEDIAYSLLGIFNIQMSLYYGEGRQRAMMRLQRKIKKSFLDQPSLLSLHSLSIEPRNQNRMDRSPISPDGRTNFLGPLDRSSLVSTCLDVLEQFGFHDDALIQNMPKETTTEVGSIPTLRVEKNGNRGASGGTGRYPNDIEFVQKTISLLTNLEPPSKYELRLSKRATGLEEGKYDKRSQAWTGNINARTSVQLLSNMLQEYKLRSLDTIKEWLGVKTFDERYNVTQYFDKQVSSRLEGTCEWIFSHPDYCKWISDDESAKTNKILWIYAPAGYGKTVLCTKLIEHLTNLKSFPVAFFFASPHAQSGGDPSDIVRFWIAQMAQLDPNVLQLVLRQSKVEGKASSSVVWSLFRSVVSENNNLAFVLDGFDEYSKLEDIRTEFLQKLKETIEQTATRILITSREETDITAELTPTVSQNAGQVMLQIRISNEDVQDDIALFSRNVVDKKLPKKDESLRKDLAEELTAKCNGMFLWIKLQQDQLRSGKNAKQLQAIVRNMPVGLEKTYERNWTTIQNHSHEERKRALAILRWTTFALRPLTVSEITEALIVEPGDDGVTLQLDELPDSIDDDYINSEIIDICGDLVEVRAEKAGDGPGSRTIHLIHLSVREFLLPILSSNAIDPLGLDLRPTQVPNQASQHEYCTTTCLEYLDCDAMWQRRREQGEQAHDSDFLTYAAIQWNAHMIPAGEDSAALIRLAEKFFSLENKNFHHWRTYLESSDYYTDEKDKGLATPLYYAALFGLPNTIERICTKDPSQLNAVGGRYGTPLQAVCVEGHEAAFHILIKLGASPNTEGGEFSYPLHAAVTRGRSGMVKALIQAGADIALQDSRGRKALYTAVLNGDMENSRLIIEAGADCKTSIHDGWGLMSIAASNGYLEVVKLLEEQGADVKFLDQSNYTPLLLAAGGGHIEVTKYLLDKGADVGIAADDGWTPLNLASSRGYIETVKLLLEKGADTEAATKTGYSSIHIAANYGHLDVIKLLLEKGAKIEGNDADKYTPLISASHNGHLEVVKYLSEKGADIKAIANDGWTSINTAARNGHAEVVKLLLEKGTDITVVNSGGDTPLYTAADNDCLEVVQLLKEKGANINVPSEAGWTPLNATACNGNLEMVTYLLDSGADMAIANSGGCTPLHTAAEHSHVEIVKILLERGADKEVITDSGCTPLQTAIVAKDIEIVRLLIEQGADLNCTVRVLGSLANVAAWEGSLEILRLLHLEHSARLDIMDQNGHNIFWYAARRGHHEIFEYLLKSDLKLEQGGATVRDILNAAALGGSLETVRTIITLIPEEEQAPDAYWNPLHWACRVGDAPMIEELVENGWKGETVSLTAPEGDWSPFSIGIYHGQEKKLEELPASTRSILGADDNTVHFPAREHGGYSCDGCSCEIFGPRWQCGTCPLFDYCIMCYPFLKQFHGDHKWELVEAPVS